MHDEVGPVVVEQVLAVRLRRLEHAAVDQLRVVAKRPCGLRPRRAVRRSGGCAGWRAGGACGLRARSSRRTRRSEGAAGRAGALVVGDHVDAPLVARVAARTASTRTPRPAPPPPRGSACARRWRRPGRRCAGGRAARSRRSRPARSGCRAPCSPRSARRCPSRRSRCRGCPGRRGRPERRRRSTAGSRPRGRRWAAPTSTGSCPRLARWAIRWALSSKPAWSEPRWTRTRSHPAVWRSRSLAWTGYRVAGRSPVWTECPAAGWSRASRGDSVTWSVVDSAADVLAATAGLRGRRRRHPARPARRRGAAGPATSPAPAVWAARGRRCSPPRRGRCSRRRRPTRRARSRAG